jgi:IS66 Orf2 like protein
MWVWLACGHTDMRKGMDGLAMLARQALEQDPFSGALFAFRGKRGGLVKLLWFDGQGMPVQQETGARSLHLACDQHRTRVPDSGATVHVAVRHRLAHTCPRSPPGTGGLDARAHARFIGPDS